MKESSKMYTRILQTSRNLSNAGQSKGLPDVSPADTEHTYMHKDQQISKTKGCYVNMNPMLFYKNCLSHLKS